MRYTCVKVIETTLFDQILNDPEDIRNVLLSLKDKELTCSIQVKSGPLHQNVRILQVNDSTITWRMVVHGTSLRKISPIEDIALLRVVTDEELTVRLKPEPSRWSVLDTSD